MKRRYSIYILSLLIIPLFSCEKIIEIDIPDSERKIVVNGLINPDSLVRINLSRSLSVLEDNDFVYLENASASLFENDQQVGDLQYQGDGFYFLPDFLPASESTYRLEVSSPGLQSVSAVTELPNPITLGDLDTATVANEWDEELRISFTISDPGNEQNRYAVTIFSTFKFFDWETMMQTDSLVTEPAYFSFIEGTGDGLQDRVIEDRTSVFFGNKMFLTDALFNGRDFEVNLTVGKYAFFEADTIWMDVNLEHVAEPYYFYAISSNKYQRSNGNPFAEPVSVYTNIEKGLGLFSGYTSSSKQLVITNSGGK